jgi:formate hydrogenlyase subunit 3/multisubunit Na+/H+ antiporter MnhD subunit
MVWVFLAADVFSFLLAWELMALSSYFLIVGFKSEPETRHAGFLYLLLAHVSALAILSSFAFMLHGQSQWTFAVIQQTHIPLIDASMALILMVLGFGAKAGVVPLHIWLPEAHPAAPSPISALMSGVMLKTAIYGLIRVGFGLLGTHFVWSGIWLLILGLITAFFGVILAAMQSDMKRLLAYSSIENIGIIVAALGLAQIFHEFSQNALAILTLSAALFHCVSHALFKGLLFLSTGSVLHATGERNLGKLGGLIRSMPWVAVLTLVGVLAIAGIPPLNGFVSEWLLIQAFLYSLHIPDPYIALLMPVAAAVFVLVLGLAAYVMVKFYGIIFLGKPRETSLVQAHDASFVEKAGMLWLISMCIFLGLFPFQLLKFAIPTAITAMGNSPALFPMPKSCLFLVPMSVAHASYSPVIFLLAIVFLSGFLYGVIRIFYHGKIIRGAAWDCGFPAQTARMQDTAEGFGQPIKQIFASFLHIRKELPNPFDQTPHYRVVAEDRFWQILYFPIVRGIAQCAKKVSCLQQGRISIYLLYSFLTLLLLLGWTLWR